jgi:hypothetical protein
MADEPKTEIIDLFSRKKKTVEPVDPKVAELQKECPGVDSMDFVTINSMGKKILAGEIHGICAFATHVGDGGPRLFIAIPSGIEAQLTAIRYLGQLRMLEDYLVDIARGEVEVEA